MSVLQSAPSNIALIKYMGKNENSGNVPTNASLSYTLDHLRTFVRLTKISEAADSWSKLEGPDYEPMNLSDKGQGRFLEHFKMLKKHWNVSDHYLIESANNFPADCGLASSASSFAALTLAAAHVFAPTEDLKSLSELSRRGSGSSCRSMFAPWALWQKEFAEPVELPYAKLIHQVILVENSKKDISSSQAHSLVAESSLFPGRVVRAEKRLIELTSALRARDWRKSFEITWSEFWDMHALFSTSTPPFMYMTSGSMQVLEEVLRQWKQNDDGPLVTMDAGANVHLLWREDQAALASAQDKYWQERFRVISSGSEKNS
ncbi:MAG: diphosphomevalonate decarboxylase [Bdellovibrionaceae bacterium]|nr:diphosphomevalonate decarboxylase [Pseudobdellovibrionaceae bacterium]